MSTHVHDSKLKSSWPTLWTLLFILVLMVCIMLLYIWQRPGGPEDLRRLGLGLTSWSFWGPVLSTLVILTVVLTPFVILAARDSQRRWRDRVALPLTNRVDRLIELYRQELSINPDDLSSDPVDQLVVQTLSNLKAGRADHLIPGTRRDDGSVVVPDVLERR